MSLTSGIVFHRFCCPASLSGGLTLRFFSPCDSVSSPSSDRRDQTSRSRSAVFIPRARSRVNDFPTSRSFFFAARSRDRRDAIPSFHALAFSSRRSSELRSFLPATSVRRRADESRPAIAPFVKGVSAAAGDSGGRRPVASAVRQAVTGGVVPGVGVEPTWGVSPEGF